MKLNLCFSTCPNDTFIFDAMLRQKINTEGLTFETLLADVEELNNKAFSSEADITKLSYHAFAYVSNNYRLLTSGSALGNACGPLLISKYKIYPDEIKDIKIAIPGKYTTANLLLKIAFPEIKEPNNYLFSDIEEAILSNEVDAGVIIHENRFTYQQKGLKKIQDLGEYWENKTQKPIPLGGIAINKKLPLEIQQKVNRVLKRSVEYALKNPTESYDFIHQHAQEMSSEVMYNHIKLYVNNYTVELGKKGKEAIEILYKEAQEKGIIKNISENIFVPEK